MKNGLYITKNPNNIILKLFYIYFLYSIQYKNINCNTCKTNNTISNTECFNNILIFDDKEYKYGQFAKNKNGDIIIEYSTESTRLFYGLKSNGEFLFSNENNHVKIIENINGELGISERYESKNIFISLEDDINRDNQFLFSTSVFNSINFYLVQVFLTV